jgi:hypothetical protein
LARQSFSRSVCHRQRGRDIEVGDDHRGAGLLGGPRGVARGVARGRLLDVERDRGLLGLELELGFVESDLDALFGGAARMAEIGAFDARALQARVVGRRRDQRGLERGRERRRGQRRERCQCRSAPHHSITSAW